MQKKKVVAIIPSAGMGKRMGSVKKKNYLPLLGKPILAWTLEAFERCAAVDNVIVAVSEDDVSFCRYEIVERYGFAKVMKIVAGGAERQDSVENAILAAGDGWDVIAVHDGARPLVTDFVITETIKAAFSEGAAIAAVPVKDTIKEALNGYVSRTVERAPLVSVQTPQAFSSVILKDAFKKARAEGFTGTDESSLVERLGVKVRVVGGSYENLKVTTPEDIPFAELVLKRRNTAQV